MAAMVAFVGMTKDAGAAITISLEWGACGGGTLGCTATGGNTITVNPGGGQTVRLDVYMTHNLDTTDGFGMESHTFSLDFDTSLENELNLGPMAQAEWAGSDVDPSPTVSNLYAPLTPGMTTRESSGAVVGRINSIESAGFANLPENGITYSVGTFSATAPARYRVAQAFFTVTGAATDGVDIFAGLFNLGFDQFIVGDGLGTIINPGTITFGSATINVVPEPGTVTLLGLGLVGLVLAGRRSRRS
jgi:hypothetical protein